ncbi:DUF6183 family protein [Kitasatospora sp. NPDC001664]
MATDLHTLLDTVRTGEYPDNDVATVIAELVDRAHWFFPGTRSPWFNAVRWDLSLAALHSAGHRVTVLAATGTD